MSWQNQRNACVASEDSDQPGHPPSLIRVFAFRLKKAWVLSYPLSAQRRLIRLGGCPGWSESSLGAHLFCWFCRVMAHMSLVMRKSVLGSLRPGKTLTGLLSWWDSYGLEILDLASRGIILSRQWTTKALIRLRKCAGWSAPLLFAYGKSRFCHDMTHIILGCVIMVISSKLESCLFEACVFLTDVYIITQIRELCCFSEAMYFIQTFVVSESLHDSAFETHWNTIRASSWQNVSSGLSDQARHKHGLRSHRS